MEQFVQFVLDNEHADAARLLLSRGRWPDMDVSLAAATIEGRRRMRRKVPAWYAVPALIYPDRLAVEQCSGEAAALYKARVATEIICDKNRRAGSHFNTSGNRADTAANGPAEGPSGAFEADFDANGPTEGPSGAAATVIADLTGGLGVDSWAFSKIAGKVLYNEMNSPLAAAAEKNFVSLGLRNIAVSSKTLVPGSLHDILNGEKPDLIYLDPARRDSSGKKVFLLEDCSPDIVSLQDELLSACPDILVKLSPMADITMILKRLRSVVSIRVCAFGGECKELLVHISHGHDGPVRIIVCEDGREIEFSPRLIRAETYTDQSPAANGPAEGPSGAEGMRIKPGQRLFEPGKALAKAGVFDEITARFGLVALGPDTHLYLLPENGETPLSPFGKIFEIIDIAPLDKRTMKKMGALWREASVTARGIQMSSEELRRRLGCREGSDLHIFGCSTTLRTESSSPSAGTDTLHTGNKLLLVCRPQK